MRRTSALSVSRQSPEVLRVESNTTGSNATLINPPSSTSFEDSLFPLRAIRQGPESTLVESFIKSLDLPLRKGHRQTLVREPSLLSGYPDLVAVQWSEATATHWNSERNKLTTNDVRLAQLLHGSGSLDEATLQKLSGAKYRLALSRLERVGIVRCQNARWRLTNIRSIFSVRRIVSFEAKTEANAKVLEQAALNKWFASMSYALLPMIPSLDFRERAVALGVGIWIVGHSTPFIRAPLANTQPASYASWLFNEYVCGIAASRQRSDA
jgi:hypothetical protein